MHNPFLSKSPKKGICLQSILNEREQKSSFPSQFNFPPKQEFSTPQKAIFTTIHPQEQLNTKLQNPQPQNPQNPQNPQHLQYPQHSQNPQYPQYSQNPDDSMEN